MARMRSLKPEFWLDRKLARSLSRDERMLYLGLWNQADEWARVNGDARVIKGQIFPFDDDLTLDVLETMLKALAVAGVVQQYDVDGDPFLFLPKLAKHQRLEPQKVPSRHPGPPALAPDRQVQVTPERRPDESAPDPSGTQTSPRGIRAKQVAGSREHVAGGRGTDESAPNANDASRSSTRGTRIPDDFALDDQLRTFGHDLGFTDQRLDQLTESFRDYWRAKPGAGGVKLDWPATWRNWVRREAQQRPPVTAGASATGLRPWEL